jgi:hypothetical protein
VIDAALAPATSTIPLPLTFRLPPARYALSTSGDPYKVTAAPVPAAKVAASAALEVLSEASVAQFKLAPPPAVKVSAAEPGAASACAAKGIATQAPGVVVTVAGVPRMATAFGTLVGAAAVPLEPTVDITEAVKGVVLTVWAATPPPPSSRWAVTVSV